MTTLDKNTKRLYFTTLGDGGQVLIPKDLLELIGIQAGAVYELSVIKDRIDIKFLD